MEEEERWCQRKRRGERGGEVEQQRGAKTVAPLHMPWPESWAPPALTWPPGPRALEPPAVQHPGLWMEAGGVHVWRVQARLAVSERRQRGLWVPRLPSQARAPGHLPASERSRRELLSAPRLSPSPAP